MPKRSVESWNTGLLHRRNIGCSLKSQNRKSSPLPGAKRAAIGKNYRRTVRLGDRPLPDGSRTTDRPGRPGGNAALIPICFYCSIKAYKLVSRRREGMFYPDEIETQETHTKHRKLDSEATLSHRARGRAADGLRSEAWPLRASRRDHDPGRLSARSASLRGLRPAMAADRAIRGPPARSPGQEWLPQRAPDLR